MLGSLGPQAVTPTRVKVVMSPIAILFVFEVNLMPLLTLEVNLMPLLTLEASLMPLPVNEDSCR